MRKSQCVPALSLGLAGGAISLAWGEPRLGHAHGAISLARGEPRLGHAHGLSTPKVLGRRTGVERGRTWPARIRLGQHTLEVRALDSDPPADPQRRQRPLVYPLSGRPDYLD